MSLTWGLCQGMCSAIPYFYSVFFIVVLIHRCGRDFERCVVSPFSQQTKPTYPITINRCAVKYGKDWERYCEAVPYKFIPFVY